MSFCELQVTSNFSFLRGASHPEELVETAAALGYKALAITDRNSLAGIVRAHTAAKKNGLRLLPACRLDLQDAPSLLAYPMNKAGYARLCGLLTKGNLRTEKGSCLLYRGDLGEANADIRFVLVPPEKWATGYDFAPAFYEAAGHYRELLGDRLSLVAACGYEGQDAKRLFRLAALSQKMCMPLLASNDVYYHLPERRQLQDVLTCVREKTTIQQAGYLLHRNAERHLKAIDEMQRLFMHHSAALTHSLELEEACSFSLDSLEYVYPEEIKRPDRPAQEELAELTWAGAKERFRENIPAKVCDALEKELRFVEEKNYASYFLTVYDIVRFARSQNILCQGRGSAANSSICYCLGITSVNPADFDLLFERFISSARDEPPDIDVDFEHERREEVIQYIYNKYGRDRAAIVATVTELHQKGAIRDVGKAMGLSVDTINRLSDNMRHHSYEWVDAKKHIRETIPQDPYLRKVLELTQQMMGFPRQLGQHTGGFVISRRPLTELCPILNARMENRTCIEWNKDDIEDLRFMKVDVLGLGMLTCIRKAFELGKKYYGFDWTLANIPQNEKEVYDMISRADTLGVFQIESRAQQTMLPRLKPKEFYDLVIEVAIVRPGPIQGDMVHPYLRRRNGEEPVEYPSPELKAILERTLGVPLFQEQAMKIAIEAAGFTPSEADGLRRSMATFKAKGKVNDFETRLIRGMLAKGYSEEFAKRIFRQLEGFGSYGFPESHAVSFALLVYVSSWIKCFHPDIFATALLNSMPMGFYQPAHIINDA
ncbi:MAG: error-prone DNA polymerase, partial [Flavihumibacter sp.]